MMIQTRSTVIFVLVALTASACGLGMDTQGRLDRGQKALVEGEYRAAIIDAKNILLEEPNNVAARLLLGRASVQIGDGVSAEKELRKAVELGTDSSVVFADLGRAMLMQNKFEEIIAEIEPDLVASNTDRLAVMQTRGEALLGLQQPDSARDVFTEILDADENNIAAQLGVVRSYMVERNYMQARATLDQILSFDENSALAWMTSGALAMRMRNYQRATVDFEKAVGLSQEKGDAAMEIQALSGFADAVMVQNDFAAAQPIFARMSEIAPSDSRTLLVKARLAVSDKDWTLAQETLQEILRRLPDYRPAQMLLGAVHKESGNLGQAEMYLSAVVAAVPGDSNARRLLAETRLELNKADQAREVLEPLLNAPIADVSSLSMAAGASLALGEFDEAEDFLTRAVHSDPENIALKFQLAVAYLRSGKLDSAQELLEGISASENSADDFQRGYLMVITRVAQGSNSQALEDAHALLADWPERAEAHSLLGSVEMSLRDYEAARKSFSRASELAPDNIAAIRNLAMLDASDNDLESARDRYLVILELQPADSRSMIALAQLAILGEQYDAATEWLEKAREADAKAFAPRLVLGSVYIATKKFAAAESVANEAIDIDPNNAKAHNILGIALLNRERFLDAEISFAKAFAIAPDEPSYQLNVAKARARQGNSRSAIESLQVDVDRSLRHIPSAIALASLKADTGDLDGALDIAEQLLAANPDDATVHVLNAEVLAKAGNWAKASAMYDQANVLEISPRNAIRAYQIRTQGGLANPLESLLAYIDKRPFDSNMRNYLAGVYQRMDETGKAITQYERILKDEPKNFVAANNLAWNYFVSGDSRAENVARQAYAIRPDNSSVADTLGWILVKKGTLEEGIDVLREASELGRGRPDILYHLAAGLLEAGQKSEAETILQEILSTEDEFSSRKEAEDLLKTL